MEEEKARPVPNGGRQSGIPLSDSLRGSCDVKGGRRPSHRSFGGSTTSELGCATSRTALHNAPRPAGRDVLRWTAHGIGRPLSSRASTAAMSETLPPAMCDVLGRFLAGPPQNREGALALAAALRTLLPEARVAYLLGPSFHVWSPEDAPPELHPPLAVCPRQTEWSHKKLRFRGVDTPVGTLGAAVAAEVADAILPRLRLAGALVTAAWRAEAWGHPQTRELLTLGEASGGLVHTLNNQLNSIVMH